MTATEQPAGATADQTLRDVAAEGVSVGYGKMTVLRDLSFAVAPGECVGLLGPNGAGKTTLLNCLAGLLQPSEGRILSGGRDITSVSPEDRRRRGLVLVQEGRRIFPRLTVDETLVLAHETLGVGKAAIGDHIAEMYVRFPALRARRDVAAGLLSGGEQQMLCLARAMACRPTLMLIDEPFMGLAPLVISQLTNYVKDIRETGVTTVIAEESRTMLERLGADRLVAIHTLEA